MLYFRTLRICPVCGNMHFARHKRKWYHRWFGIRKLQQCSLCGSLSYKIIKFYVYRTVALNDLIHKRELEGRKDDDQRKSSRNPVRLKLKILEVQRGKEGKVEKVNSHPIQSLDFSNSGIAIQTTLVLDRGDILLCKSPFHQFLVRAKVLNVCPEEKANSFKYGCELLQPVMVQPHHDLGSDSSFNTTILAENPVD